MRGKRSTSLLADNSNRSPALSTDLKTGLLSPRVSHVFTDSPGIILNPSTKGADPKIPAGNPVLFFGFRAGKGEGIAQDDLYGMKGSFR
jgi:hypothetical protein